MTKTRQLTRTTSRYEDLASRLKLLTIPGYDFDRTRPKGDQLVEINVAPTVHVRDDRLIVSAEDGKGFADYYPESLDGGYRDPFINPVLEKWAKENGGHFEWENPGCIMFVQD
jgi:hypothetical protein